MFPPRLRQILRPMGFPAPPAAPPARRATPDAIAHAFGVMLARDYPDQAYDLSDAVARGVQIGLREGAQ